jgi:hypothetical protein
VPVCKRTMKEVAGGRRGDSRESIGQEIEAANHPGAAWTRLRPSPFTLIYIYFCGRLQLHLHPLRSPSSRPRRPLPTGPCRWPLPYPQRSRPPELATCKSLSAQAYPEQTAKRHGVPDWALSNRCDGARPEFQPYSGLSPRTLRAACVSGCCMHDFSLMKVV